MHLVPRLLKKRYAVATLVLAAAALGAGGLLGYLFQYSPPTTYNFPTAIQMGRLDADGTGIEGRTVTQQLGPNGMPVLSVDEPWPITGGRCGPTRLTEVQTDAWVNGVNVDSRIFNQLFTTNPTVFGSEQGVDGEGNANCLYYSGELQPETFAPGLLATIAERGSITVELVFDNHEAVDGSTAPQSVTSELFLAVAGDPGPRDTVVVPAAAIDFDPSQLALDGSTSNQGLVNRLGLVAMGLAALSFLLIPVAALLPTRDALKAERSARESFFTANPDPILTAMPDGLITRHSPAMARLLRVDSLDGRSVHDFIADFDPVIDLTGDGNSAQSSAEAIRGDGSVIPVDISHMHTEVHGQQQQVAVIRDASSRLKAQTAQMEIAAAEAQAATAAELLAASHHSLNREILGIGFALDDLEDDPTDEEAMEGMQSALALLEQGRDELYAIGTLSKYDVSPTKKTVTAEDLRVVGHEGISVECETIEPLVEVDPLILRLAITNAARNGAVHGGATAVRIVTSASTLLIQDNGSAADNDALQHAWVSGERPNGTSGQGLQIIQRCAAASNGVARIDGSQLGVTVTINFHGRTEDDPISRRRIPVGQQVH